MDALTAALVAALLAHAGDRTPAFASRLGDRCQASAAALAGLLLAIVASNALAAAGSVIARPLMFPEAATLLLALALLMSGAGALGRSKGTGRDLARLGPFGAGLVPGLILMLADRAPFLVFAIGARSPLPWAAGIGGSLGALAVAVPAFFAGEAALGPLPWRAVRLGGGVLFLIAGAALALAAFGLV